MADNMRVRAEIGFALMAHLSGGTRWAITVRSLRCAPGFTGWRRYNPHGAKQVTTLGTLIIPTPVPAELHQCRRQRSLRR